MTPRSGLPPAFGRALAEQLLSDVVREAASIAPENDAEAEKASSRAPAVGALCVR
jgi:hypothetical protein